jgi:glycosyltransferase involved in cell wall biosynthesis/Flp pilus assembly protein TadD
MPRTLFGPVTAAFAAEYLSELRRSGDCLAFNTEGDVDVTVCSEATWPDILERLPADWRPDLLALWLGEQPLPPALWSAPVPIIGLVRHWERFWPWYLQVLPGCEGVLADPAGAEALIQVGLTQTRPAHLCGLGQALLDAGNPEELRDIDILFVGSLHPAIAAETLAWLERVVAFGAHWRVVVTGGLPEGELRKLLRRTRVVFDGSTRGEGCWRSLETASSGALVVQPRSPNPGPFLLEPGREMVVVTRDDLETVLTWYLTHEAERARLARSGQERARGQSFTNQWRQALDLIIPSLEILGEQARRRPAPDPAKALLSRAWQPGFLDPTLTRDLATALAQAPRSGTLHAALGLGIASEVAGGGPTTIAAAVAAVRHLHRAVVCEPGDPALHLNLAEALEGCGDVRRAVDVARRALTLLNFPAGRENRECASVRFPPGFDPFRISWERIGWEHGGRPKAQAAARQDLLRWRLHTLLGRLTGDLAHYHEAVLIRPDLQPSQADLGCALAKAGRAADAVPHLRRAVAADPTDATSARALWHAAVESGQGAECCRLADQRRLLRQAAPFVLPPEPWFAAGIPHAVPSGPPVWAAPSVPMSISWEGAFRAVHSLAACNRQLCQALLNRGHTLSLVPEGPEDAPEALVPLGALAPRYGRLLDHADIHIGLRWPPSWRKPRSGVWVVFQPWEYGSLPRSWIKPLREEVDEVWVPASWVRDCFVASGVPAERIQVIPLGVDVRIFRPGVAPYPLRTCKRTRFLFVGGTIYRKGFDLLLDAYARTFRRSDDVCLVVKDMGNRTFYHGQTGEQLLARLQSDPTAPEVEYLNGEMTAEAMSGLYAACDCLVQPYRGEGFGLPLVEALACERPVIVTDYGPSRDFCQPGWSWLLPASIRYQTTAQAGSMETVSLPWLAEPDGQALCETLRAVYENPEDRRTRGWLGREVVAARWTWEHAAAALEKRLVVLRAGAFLQGHQTVATMSPGAGRFDEIVPDVVVTQPGQVADPGPSKGSFRARVSLCLIVRNEEHNLPDCLDSVAGQFDEIIVVDTGSQDGTREVARSRGALVSEFPWVDDFAAARNACLERATGDFIFWLDADDRLDPGEGDKLRNLLARLPDEHVAYSMKCQCVTRDRTEGATVVDHIRLFRRRPDVRWEFRVHEQILGAIRRSGGRVLRGDVTIRHVGYADTEVRRRKLDRDLKLLERERTDRPDHPFVLFNLAMVLFEVQQTAEALPLIRRSLEKSAPGDSIVRKLHALLCHCLNHLGQKEEALAATAAGLAACPDDTELLFARGLMFLERNDLLGAEDCYRRLLTAHDDPEFACVVEGLRGYRAHNNLAVALGRQGRLAEGEVAYQAALREHPLFAPALVGLAEMYLLQARWPDLDKHLEVWARQRPAEVGPVVLRARGQMARKEFRAARTLLEAAVTAAPQNVWPQSVLSQCLLQEGLDFNAAEKALLRVLELDPGNAAARTNLTVLRSRWQNSITFSPG